MLTINNVSLSLQNRNILKGISVTINAGSITTLVGKSGAGKSTLLECITQLQTNYTGTIAIEGCNIRDIQPGERAEIVGMVFQQWYLFPTLTVLENCTQQLIVVQKLAKKEAAEKAEGLLEFFEMGDYRNAYPTTLSGGQQQRVAIARAMCLQPKILCLDEPTSALDAENTANLVCKLQELNASGTTIIASSHDSNFIQALGGKKLCIVQGSILSEA